MLDVQFERSSLLKGSRLTKIGRERRGPTNSMARILIADDEESFSLLLQRALVAAGHESRLAKDGNEALTALKAAPVDLAIVDIFMPGKDGIETIQEFRRLSPSVKIIAITGSVSKTSSSLLVMAQKLGAHQALSKPFSVEQILAAVDGLLAKSDT